jgi:WD40 repeat protein
LKGDQAKTPGDAFAAWLLAYDEALAAGRPAEDLPAVRPEVAPDARAAEDCLRLLEKVWPRRPVSPSSAGTLPLSDADPEAAPNCAPLTPLPPVGTPGRLGRFQLLRELGRGGCGIVFLALDPVLGRPVALKVPHPEALLHPDLRARFLREAQAAAGLDHPNVVPVYEAGEIGPVCYIAAAYCEGLTLAAWLKQRGEPVPVRTAAALVATLAGAIAYTHGRGVLHRDLKPGNILLTPGRNGEDGLDFVPRVTDFGLAKLLDAEAGPASDGRTRTGMIVGTPEYMAPEQAEGRHQDAGPHTDVYALGVILYELLTGRAPLVGKSYPDTLRRVVSEEPPPPTRLRSNVHPDLQTICLKCLRKEPAGRYASAGDLAADLRRFLNGEPIRARPVGRAERAWRWCRRNPASAALALVSAAALLLLLPGALWYHLRLAAARNAEQTANDLAAAARKAEAAAREAATLRQYYALLHRVRERNAARRLGWTWANLRDLELAARLETAARDPVELRSEAADSLAGVDLRDKGVLLRDFSAFVLAFSPDGKTLAVGQFKAPAFIAPCSIVLIDLAAGKPRRTVTFQPSVILIKKSPVQDGVRALAFSPDGRWLLAGTRAGWIHRWDLARECPQAVTWKAHDDIVTRLMVHPDGHSLYSQGCDGKLRRWDDPAAAKQGARPAAETACRHSALSPCGDVLACCGEDRIDFLDPRTLKPCRPAVPARASNVAFSPDGRTIAAAAEGILLADAESGEALRTVQDPEAEAAHQGGISNLEFNGDGSLLVSACSSDSDRKIKLWETATGRLQAAVAVAGTDNIHPSFSPDGHTLAATGDRRVYLYEVGGRREQTMLAQQAQPVRAIAFAPNGNLLACVNEQGSHTPTCRGEVTLWDVATGERSAQRAFASPLETRAEPSLAFHPEGTLLAFSASTPGVHLWDTHAASDVRTLAVGRASALSFSAGEPRVWAVADGDEVRSWDLPDGRQATRWSNAGSELLTGLSTLMSLAAGRQWVVAGGRDGLVRLLRVCDGRPEAMWSGPGGPIRSVALCADEKLAAAGTQDGGVRIFSVPGGEVIANLEGHQESVAGLSFSHDGRLLASASLDRTVRLWERRGSTFGPFLVLRFRSGPVRAACFSPDGTQLATLVNKETAVRLWHLDRLRARLRDLHLDGER